MSIGAQVRKYLLTLPVAVQLAVLAGVGLLSPHYISEISEPTLSALTLTIGLPATALTAAAAFRCPRQLQASWAAMALACGLWCAALFGAIKGWPNFMVWGELRGFALIAVTLAILLSPGVRRSAREWGLLLLDGWLVGVSAFLIGWVVLRLTTSTLAGKPLPPALYWIPFDLVIASAVTGLAIRTRGSPATLALLVLSMLLTVTSDTTWALTASPDHHGITPFGVLEWLITLFALGSATLTRQLDPWSTEQPESQNLLARPPLTRLAQMAMVPGLLAAAAPGADRLTFIAAASLIAGLTVEVALTRRQHQDLWLALCNQTQQLQQLLQESRDAIVRIDRTGRIDFASDAVAEVFGHPAGDLVGTNWFDLALPEDRKTMATRLADLIKLSQFQGLDVDDIASCRIGGRFRHGNGTWRELESTASLRGEGSGFTLSIRDVSERSRLEADLRRQASTDGLTGLFNRQAFITLLQERLPRGDAHILFLDLDGFKTVNDTGGHVIGDRLLCDVANALRAELRPGDIAARFGGDEFAVLPAVRDLDGTCALAARLVARIGSLSVQHKLQISASIGVADGRQDAPEAVIKRADLAMYQAKAAGGGRVVVYAGPHPHQIGPPAHQIAPSPLLRTAIPSTGVAASIQPNPHQHDSNLPLP